MVVMISIVQEHEAAEAQREVERRIEEARIQEEESRRLQAELERARIEMEDNQRALQEALASPKVLYIREHDDDNKSSGLLYTCTTPSLLDLEVFISVGVQQFGDVAAYIMTL